MLHHHHLYRPQSQPETVWLVVHVHYHYVKACALAPFRGIRALARGYMRVYLSSLRCRGGFCLDMFGRVWPTGSDDQP